VPFLVLLLVFVGRIFTMDGFAVDPTTGDVYMEPFKYWHNLDAALVILLVLGLAAFVGGLVFSLFTERFRRGIWFTGLGTVLVVLTLFGLVGYNHTAYYPSTADLQSSLTLANSCASQFTLRTMAYVSFLIPFVLAYIIYAWRRIEYKRISLEELAESSDKY
jgi:cytochrome d ubiquinol oxidase subunit II